MSFCHEGRGWMRTRKEAEEGEARGHTGCSNSLQNEGSGWEPKEDGLFSCSLFGTLVDVPTS